MVLFVVVDSAGDNLRLRFGPGMDFDEVAKVPDGTLLKALDDAHTVRTTIGKAGEWLHVQAPEGQVGYCAAWFLALEPFGEKPAIAQPPVGTPTSYVIVESPGAGLRLRDGPGTEYARTWWMPHRTVLESLEDPVATGAKVGQRGAWVRVRTPSRREGYVAAWYLRYPAQADERPRVAQAGVRTGESPHIFGIHALAASDDQIVRDRMRGLYHESGKAGWVLFTEICGRHARSISMNPEIRRRLWNWADAGYGVIIRLNHGYEPGGTIPESRLYDDFAAAAARWVELYLRDSNRSASTYTWAVQIGNEQNNPREHPGGFEHPTEHITAHRYADAFNRTYARIKAVLPNAIVCPGGIDPFNYMPMQKLGNVRWRPLDYFTEMMSGIDALDGVVLHTYTHGPDPAYITHLKRFGDGSGPLGDHYYDFQSYRTFMERIPAKWRDVPVYITEMNHIHRPAGEHDQGWVDKNVGWLRAAYEEIDRWNRQPYAQQIRCALIYRWMGDAWAIVNKPEVLTEFKQALTSDYRWRGAPQREAHSFAITSLADGGARPSELEERFLVSPDDLMQVKGVGEIGAAALNAAGIYLFEQLARLTSEQLADIIGETGIRAHFLTTWPQQARLAAAADWPALQHFREQLREP
jgi:predicted flap endonuclease-1-like 5' DNA nuclease